MSDSAEVIEAKKRAKAITDKAHMTLEDRRYIEGFADGLLVGQQGGESDPSGK